MSNKKNQDEIVVLITGANRGLGLGLAKQYLQRPRHVVVAGIRRPDQAQVLESLQRDASSRLVVQHMDSADLSTITTALTQLASQGYDSLDIVIANAGISKVHPLASDVKLTDLREHLEINTIAPLALFQVTRPFLLAAAEKGRTPKFIGISSSAASIGGMDKRIMPNSAYGPSKAALNYLVRKIHYEDEQIISFVLDPGWVKTDMGNAGAVSFGMPEAETEIEDSVGGMIKVIDEAKRETHAGSFKHFEGGNYPW